MAYLKSALPTGKVVKVTIIERKGTVTGQYGPKVAYLMKYEGKMYDHEATETEERTGLSALQVNETVDCIKKANNHGTLSVYWAPAESAESRGLEQVGGNTRNTANANQAKEYEQAKKEEAHKKEMGYAKSQIGNNLGMSTKLFFDALLSMEKERQYPAEQIRPKINLEDIFIGAVTLAKSVRPRFNKVVDDCYMEDVVGANKISPSTNEKVALPEDVKKAFGEDTSFMMEKFSE